MGEGRLQRELKKKRPFASAEEEALLNVWRTHDRFQIRFARLCFCFDRMDDHRAHVH
jgi:MarR family transcriptional regulator, 2-MHQ and catechol-resistance regulon repressor